ncbi:MAG: response regulator, partial [Myxococcus sp.]|nr:response regulator [Myxococcus sp.]
MPKSVLVADDSITMRKAIGMVFSTEDFSVTMVDNGVDAINKARELRPDLVIADCVMPGKTGYEVAHAIRSDPSTAHLPVMLLAGTFEPFDENRARASGATAHIVKPFDSQAFMDRVRALVGMAPGAGPITTVSPVSTGAGRHAHQRTYAVHE